MILHGGLLESFKENIAFALGLDEEVVFIGRYGSCPCSRQNRESVGTMNSRLGEGREVWLKQRGRAKGALGWAYLWGGGRWLFVHLATGNHSSVCSGERLARAGD